MDRLCALKRGGGTGRVVEPDAVSFDLLLRICLRGGDLRGAREALCDMERRSIPPTAHTKFLQFKLFGEIPYAQYPRELIYHNNASSGNSSSIISANHAAAPPLHVNSPSSLACNATSLQQLLKQSVLPRDVSPHMFCLAIEGAAGREEVVQLLLRARDLLRLNCAVYLAAIRFALKSGDFAFAIEIANSFLDSGLSMSKYGLSSLISLSIRVGWEKGLVLLYRTLHSCKNRTPELLNDAVCDRVIACLTMDGASLPDETAAAEVGSGSADDGHLRSRASPHLALVALQLHSGPLLGLRCRPGTLAKLLRNTASLFNQPNVGSEDSYISSIKLYQTRDADGLSRFASPDLDDICRMVEEIIDSYSAVDNNYFITNKDVAAAVEKLVFTKPNGPKSHKLTNLII
jgi:pentatricopeptide repeat protein